MADDEVVFTRHAEDMLVERSIERAWVHATIRDPEVTEVDPKRPGVVRAFRRIPQHGGRTLCVAYVTAAGRVRVLTVFFDRRRRQQ